jgi:hypothetical protein
MVMEQLAPAARVDPQFPETAKSLAFAPLTDREIPFSGALPELRRVMLCAFELTPTAWFPKLTFVVDKLAMGAVPVPESAMGSC